MAFHPTDPDFTIGGTQDNGTLSYDGPGGTTWTRVIGGDGGYSQIEGNFPQAPFPKREQREEFVKDWHQVPDEKFKEYFLKWEKRNEMSTQALCDIVDWNEAMHYIDDSIG